MSNIDAAELQYEEKIVWLEDIAPLYFVRESMSWQTYGVGKRGPIKLRAPRKGGMVTRHVGYATISNNRYIGSFPRRIFWVKGDDEAPVGGARGYGMPCEAVDPRSVAPGVPGTRPPERRSSEASKR